MDQMQCGPNDIYNNYEFPFRNPHSPNNTQLYRKFNRNKSTNRMMNNEENVLFSPIKKRANKNEYFNSFTEEKNVYNNPSRYKRKRQINIIKNINSNYKDNNDMNYKNNLFNCYRTVNFQKKDNNNNNKRILNTSVKNTKIKQFDNCQKLQFPKNSTSSNKSKLNDDIL